MTTWIQDHARNVVTTALATLVVLLAIFAIWAVQPFHGGEGSNWSIVAKPFLTGQVPDQPNLVVQPSLDNLPM